MPTCIMPTEEETAIDVTFSNGQEPLRIDAVDVNQIIQEWKNAEGTEELETFFLRVFQAKHNRVITRSGALHLARLATDILDSLKKTIDGSTSS